MKTIEIAPSLENTHIVGNKKIVGRLSDGSRTYVYDLPKGYKFPTKGRNEFKHAFSCAIALASKKWQAEDALNNHFGGVAGVLTIIEGPAHWIKPNKIYQ